MSDRDLVWQALSHRERRRIIDLLRDRPLTTGAIVAETGLDRFVVQRHLGVLRSAGLVTTTAQGRERHNTLNGSALYQATIGWLRPTDRRYAAALDRLRTRLEAPEEETQMEIGHLHVTQQIEIAARPDRCFAEMTSDISAWWGSPYLLIEGSDTRIFVEPRIGGVVVERAGDHEALWGTITELEPDRILAWTGRMGLGNAATGTVSFTLTDNGETTTVSLDHESIGAFGAGAQASYVSGWDDLLQRLKARLEDGASYGVAGKNSAPPTLQSAGGECH